MDDFENIKELWNSNRKLNILDTGQIQTVIKNFQAKKKRNAFLNTIFFIACGVILPLIVIFYKPLLWTTTFGEILIAIGFLSGIALKFRTLRNLTQDELKSNRDFLENLIIKSKQKGSKMNWHLIVSVLFLAVGYGFFIYQEVRDNQFHLILTYSGITLFTLVMFFIFRPFVKRNSENKVQKMLDEIEALG